ncbi:MAG TPA: hypothetical protein VFB16_04845 [Bauldia sp.]|nr:hypothetical protein [Bauldia sp.]
MRNAVVAFAAGMLAAGLADPGWAVFKPRPAGPEKCTNWDCQGGIICSCCFAGQGCWICDAKGGGNKPELNLCHWDPKISSGGGAVIRNPALNVTPINP